MGKNIGCMLGYSHLLHPHHLPPIYILFKFDTVSMSLKYSFFFSFSQECFMKEFSSFQERFMSKKIALAFAASCLTAVAAVVPVAASAQDLGSLTDLSSLSVSLFDGPQKQPSPSLSAAPSTSASAAPSTSTTAPSEPAPVVPEPTVPPRQVSEKTDYDAQVGAFRKYLMGPAGKQTFNVSIATGENASGYLLVAGNHYNRIVAGQGYTPSGREDTANLDKLVKQHNCDADDNACGTKLQQDIAKNFTNFKGFAEKSVALAVANYYGYRTQD